MINTNQFKNGMTIFINGKIFEIIEFQHVKPGKGGAFVRTKLRNFDTGSVIDKTFRAGEKFELAIMEKKTMQYLYNDGTQYYFMDNETYDQVPISADLIGDGSKYIKEGTDVEILVHNNKPLKVKPPISVELEVIKAEPGIKGDTATGGSKPVTLETGLEVQAPLFINEGDVLKVDTRTGNYVERVN